MIVPFYFHLFSLVMLFVANIAMHLPAKVGISLEMLAVSIVLHAMLAMRMFVMRRITMMQDALANEPSSMK